MRCNCFRVSSTTHNSIGAGSTVFRSMQCIMCGDRLQCSPAEPASGSKCQATAVWPLPQGKVRGYRFQPFHKSVPVAASRDEKLYELLALVDSLPDGRVRERS